MALEEPAAKRSKAETDDIRASFLERFFAKYEFTCKHMLSCSDSEAWTMSEVLDTADDEIKERWSNCSLGYTESLGDPTLLKQILAHYESRAKAELARRLPECAEGRNVSEFQVTICVPVEGIYASMMRLLRPGDHVVCQAPAYQALYEIARSKGCVLHQWRPRYDETRNFWSFSLEDLAHMLKPFSNEAPSARQSLRMLVMNSPHNPTGACFSQGQIDKISDMLLRLSKEDPPILFSDEMYSDILAAAPSAVAKLNSIVLSGLSKPWGMPGLRVGWLLVQNPEHFKSIAGFRDYTTLCLPPQSELLAIVALRNAGKFLSRNQKLARHNYLILQDFLSRHHRWFHPLNQHEHNDSVSGTDFAVVTLFARLKQPLGGHSDSQGAMHLSSVSKLVEHLAQKYSICLAAGDFFEFSDFPCVRFGIGRKSFKEALSHLESALADL